MAVHFAGANRDLQHVGLGRNRAIVILGEGAGRIVCQVKIQQVIAVLELFQIYIPAHGVTFLPGRGVAKEDVHCTFRGAGLDQTRRFQPAWSISKQKIDPTHTFCAPLVTPRGHDDGFFRLRVALQLDFIPVGQVDWEIGDALVLFEPRALRIKDDQCGNADAIAAARNGPTGCTKDQLLLHVLLPL